MIEGKSILAHIVENIRRMNVVDGIALAVAEGPENGCFVDFAQRHDLPWVLGPEHDVLQRVLTAVERFRFDTLFRVSTECPFIFADDAPRVVATHLSEGRDFTGFTGLPLGTGYELIQRPVLEAMAATGNPRYRLALSLYVYEHQDRLRVSLLEPPPECRRPEINYAVDHPGQLIFCQRAFAALARRGLPIRVVDLVRYHDENPLN